MKFRFFKILGISESCLISLYVCKGNVKGNQAALREIKQLSENSNFKIFQLLDFFWIPKMYIFLKPAEWCSNVSCYSQNEMSGKHFKSEEKTSKMSKMCDFLFSSSSNVCLSPAYTEKTTK